MGISCGDCLIDYFLFWGFLEVIVSLNRFMGISCGDCSIDYFLLWGFLEVIVLIEWVCGDLLSIFCAMCLITFQLLVLTPFP